MSTIAGKHIYNVCSFDSHIYIHGATAASVSEPARVRRNSITRRTGPVSDPSVALSGGGGGCLVPVWFQLETINRTMHIFVFNHV